jgi:hypothetical protein
MAARGSGVQICQRNMALRRRYLRRPTCDRCIHLKRRQPLQLDDPQSRNAEKGRKIESTYRYIQLLVSKFGLPVNHSGAKVIQPTKRWTTCQPFIDPYNKYPCRFMLQNNTSAPRFIPCSPTNTSEGTHMRLITKNSQIRDEGKGE